MITSFSGYRFMWLLTMFDLPTNTKKQRHDATKFRNYLLDLGFQMMQFSVYIKFCPNRDAAQKYIKKIEYNVPSEGQVTLLLFTDRQYGQMKVFTQGTMSESNKEPRSQLRLF